MYPCGLLHMDVQRQDDQLEHTYSSSEPIWDVALRTCRKQWTIGSGGERGSGISVLIARHDDYDDIIGIHVIGMKSLGIVPFGRSFWVKVVFPIVIHMFLLGIYLVQEPVCRKLAKNFKPEFMYIWRKPEFMYSRRFPDVFLPQSLLQVLVIPFPILFINSAFLLCFFRFSILLQNCFASFASSCLYFLIYSPSTCW